MRLSFQINDLSLSLSLSSSNTTASEEEGEEVHDYDYDHNHDERKKLRSNPLATTQAPHPLLQSIDYSNSTSFIASYVCTDSSRGFGNIGLDRPPPFSPLISLLRTSFLALASSSLREKQNLAMSMCTTLFPFAPISSLGHLSEGFTFLFPSSFYLRQSTT
ncbi:hypothetical protein IE53DRAFT_383759 [Violaceomyces palustris]|uniref:Uncharacterized protein n=1 Tax=Violaceomyces palustris TaxID=1673888 RepID=A0ACD0P6K8_9BASI|nr:hypothetical protein IE53DRAFT_383759 [Violaceomyces palustris]